MHLHDDSGPIPFGEARRDGTRPGYYRATILLKQRESRKTR